MIVVVELLVLGDVMGRGLAWCHLQQQQDCQGHPQRQALCCGHLKHSAVMQRASHHTSHRVNSMLHSMKCNESLRYWTSYCRFNGA